MSKLFKPPFKIKHRKAEELRSPYKFRGDKYRNTWIVTDSTGEYISHFDTKDHAEDFVEKMTDSYNNPEKYAPQFPLFNYFNPQLHYDN